MSHRIKDGSIRTLWWVSLPLILSYLSTLSMITVDRLFLAHYSTEVLGAVVSGGMAAWAFTFGAQTLTSVSAIFVSQLNGRKQYDEIGRPVWQMIWLSLALTLPFILAALFFAPWVFSESPLAGDQILYFKWAMVMSPLICLVGALNGFFIGRGKTLVITWLTLISNIINFILDPLLIFGMGPIPSLGINGACIATTIGLSVETILLSFLFLSEENRKKYKTANFKGHWKTFASMIRIGAPEAIAISLELGAWAGFYYLLANLSATHILVASVGQSLLMAFYFFGGGLEQGISSVAGNLIGADRKDEVVNAFYSGMKIISIFGFCLIAILWFGKNWIADLFLQNPDTLEIKNKLSSLSPTELKEARECILGSCLVIGVYIILEDIRCLLYGVLRAAGDTFFILMISVLATWLLLLFPTYFLMTLWRMPVYVSFWIWLTFAFSTTFICYIRFSRGRWRDKQILTLTSSSS